MVLFLGWGGGRSVMPVVCRFAVVCVAHGADTTMCVSVYFCVFLGVGCCSFALLFFSCMQWCKTTSFS
jgi:hypothetical protein